MSTAAGPYIPGKLNTQMSPVFHRREFAASAAMGSEVVFFGEVAGVNSVGPNQTNMTRAFELEAPREITVNALRVQTYLTASADLQALYWNYTLQLVIGGNAILNAPLDFWPAGGGMVGSGVANGVCDPKAVYGLLPHPIRIPSGVGFQARLLGTSLTPAATTRIGIYLDGFYSKPVS